VYATLPKVSVGEMQIAMATIVDGSWSLGAGSAMIRPSFGKTFRSDHELSHPQMGKTRRPQPQRHPVRRQPAALDRRRAAIYAIVQLGNQRVVTKYISEINFVSASRQGDIIELGITATEFGRTSITLTCEVRNKITRKASSPSKRWSSSTSAKTVCPHPTGVPRSST
jgi:hypothetical protein